MPRVAKPRKRKFKWNASAFALAVIVLVLILPWPATQMLDVYSSARELPDLVRQYRATGMPWTSADLPNYHVPDSQNAAPYLRAALAQFQLEGYDEAKKISDALQAGHFAEARQLVRPFASSLEVAAIAGKYRRLDLGRDPDSPLASFPEASACGRLVSILSARAEIRCHDGDTTEAVADVRLARSLSSLLAQEPAARALHVRTSCDDYVSRSALRCAAARPGDVGFLQQLGEALDGPPSPEALLASVKLWAFGSITEAQTADYAPECLYAPAFESCGSSDLLTSGWHGGMLQQAQVAQLVRAWLHAAPALRYLTTDPMRTATEMDSIPERISSGHPLTGRLVYWLFYNPKDIICDYQTSCARLETSHALLQALIIHDRTGRFPSSISKIPGSWSDPCSKGLLKLKVTKEGIRIYSVGPDGLDHGGVDRIELTSYQPPGTGCDVVAAYPPIKPPPPPKPVPGPPGAVSSGD